MNTKTITVNMHPDDIFTEEELERIIKIFTRFLELSPEERLEDYNKSRMENPLFKTLVDLRYEMEERGAKADNGDTIESVLKELDEQNLKGFQKDREIAQNVITKLSAYKVNMVDYIEEE